MYPVSAAFQEAIRKPERTTRVDGSIRIKTSDGSTRYAFDETAIVEKSLVITDQMTGGKFGYGSVYSRNFSIKLDYTKIDGLEGVNINLTGATVILWFYLTLADGTEEKISLGNFFVDATKSSRRFNILTISGSDYLTKLDIQSEAMTNVTPYEVFKMACDLSKQGDGGNTENEISAFPNGTLSLSFDTKQIQTARDMLMWLGDLTGTFVRARRGTGEPSPQMVQIPTKYTKGGTSGNFDLATFKEDNGSIIPADVRFSTEFTDTSIRNTTVIMNRKGAQLKYHTDWNFAPDTLEGTIELENNPLISDKSDDEVQNTILKNIQDYTDDLRFCPFKVSFNGNPAIEVGDFVYLEPGGGLDESNYYHYGIVTYSKWVYRGKCEIRCQTDVTAERPESTTTSTASLSTFAATSTSETTPLSIKPKSQLEKRMDAESGESEPAAETDRIIKIFSDYSGKSHESCLITAPYIDGDKYYVPENKMMVFSDDQNYYQGIVSPTSYIKNFDSFGDNAVEIATIPPSEIGKSLRDYFAEPEGIYKKTRVRKAAFTIKTENGTSTSGYGHFNFIFQEVPNSIYSRYDNLEIKLSKTSCDFIYTNYPEGSSAGANFKSTLSIREDGLYFNGKKLG